MNAIRTIQSDESVDWVENLFRSPPHAGPAPDWPIRFPFPFTPRRAGIDDTLYVVYDGEVIGYARIAGVQAHRADTVGTMAQRVAAGASLVIEGPLRRMPVTLQARGFTGIRYLPESLHEMRQPRAAQRALDRVLRARTP